jgi:hypothetical protein
MTSQNLIRVFHDELEAMVKDPNQVISNYGQILEGSKENGSMITLGSNLREDEYHGEK